MNKRFFLAGLAATLANLVLHAAAHFLVLKDIFRAHPPLSEEFQRQLVRPADQLVGWAMAVTALAMGFVIALAMQWAGARTFGAGLKKGAPFGFLFWASVNFGLYASSHHFSLVSVLVDFASSATIMMLSSAVAAWVLGRGSSTKPA